MQNTTTVITVLCPSWFVGQDSSSFLFQNIFMLKPGESKTSSFSFLCNFQSSLLEVNWMNSTFTFLTSPVNQQFVICPKGMILTWMIWWNSESHQRFPLSYEEFQRIPSSVVEIVGFYFKCDMTPNGLQLAYRCWYLIQNRKSTRTRGCEILVFTLPNSEKTETFGP